MQGTTKREPVISSMYKMMQQLGLSKADVEVRCSVKDQKIKIFFNPKQTDYLTCSQILCTLVYNSPCNVKIGSATLIGFKTSFYMRDFNYMVNIPFNVIPTACSACVVDNEMKDEPSEEENSADDAEHINITLDTSAQQSKE